jgi:hypothetical protein
MRWRCSTRHRRCTACLWLNLGGDHRQVELHVFGHDRKCVGLVDRSRDVCNGVHTVLDEVAPDQIFEVGDVAALTELSVQPSLSSIEGLLGVANIRGAQLGWVHVPSGGSTTSWPWAFRWSKRSCRVR